MKQKKIGFTYFLNKRLKPNMEKGEERYKVYVRITYNRSSNEMFIPLGISVFGITDDEFERLIINREDASIKAELNEFESQADQIIRFEHRVIGDSYKVAGLPEKRWIYAEPLTAVLERYIKEAFRSFLAQHLTLEQVGTICHDAMPLEDSFYLAKDIFLADLREQIPAQLSNPLTAYNEFRAFIRQRNPQAEFMPGDKMPRSVTGYDWAASSLPVDFKNFLLSPRDCRAIFPNEAASSSMCRFYDDFHAMPLQAVICLQSIDYMIAQN